MPTKSLFWHYTICGQRLLNLLQAAPMPNHLKIGETAWWKSPTFMFWDLIMRYETLILIFIRAHREKKFKLYVEVLEELAPLLFAMNHVNYARWMPVHIRDMKSLPDSIREEFLQHSNWVLSKTSHKFSAIPFDQAHEQENKIAKGAGRAVGLTENPTAFRRWMLSGPEMARLLKEFQEEYHAEDDKEDLTNLQHHEQGHSTQKKFQQHVVSLFETMKQMGNPFLDDFEELVTLDSRNCVDKSVVHTVRSLEETGKKQCKDFVKKVLLERTTSIHDPIKRNSLALFKTPQSKILPKKGEMKVLKNNVALFGQLYIAMQNRQWPQWILCPWDTIIPSFSLWFLVCYTYQVQNQTYCPALINLQKQSHLQHMTATAWMDPLLFIACQPSMSAPSTCMQIKCSFLTWRGTFKTLKDKMLCGMNISKTAWRSLLIKSEEKVYRGKCLAQPRYQAIGRIF